MPKKKPDAEQRPRTFDEALRAFTTKFRTLTYRQSPEQVFRDFAEVSACAIANRFDKGRYDEREARYIETMKSYTELEDRRLLCAMFLDFTDLCHLGGLQDVFGMLVVKLEIHTNARLGQVFSPYPLSQMMARMTLGDAKETIDRNGFITIQEPACGPGGMIIAAADALQAQDINYQQTMHVTGIDIDRFCVHMAYVQCSLFGIPAVIHRGDSLRMEIHDAWYTPMHFINQWPLKFALREMKELICPPGSIDVRERWNQLPTAERMDLLAKAGVEDLSLALGNDAPDSVRAVLEHAAA